nr:hypothetical protein L203_05024 [Cryptococcus depauperatus CBS 7841]
MFIVYFLLCNIYKRSQILDTPQTTHNLCRAGFEPATRRLHYSVMNITNN